MCEGAVVTAMQNVPSPWALLPGLLDAAAFSGRRHHGAHLLLRVSCVPTDVCCLDSS